MGKTWIVIGLGSAIIVGVMVFLTIKGVSHREHTFIKWSSADNPERLGQVSMERMFPLLKDSHQVDIIGDGGLRASFKSGFAQALTTNNLPLQVAVAEVANAENISIELKPITTTEKPGSCHEKSRDDCLLIKAQRSWHSQERDPSRYWFLLQWVAHNKFYLFFTSPQ